MAAKKKSTLSILELAGVKSSMENLMLSKELGVDNSLILHNNIKQCKPHLEDYDASVKVIQAQCYRTDEENRIIYDDNGRPEVISGKMTEFKAAMSSLNERRIEVELSVLKISKLPERLGQLQGNDFYQFVPSLFDYVYVSDQEYNDLGT